MEFGASRGASQKGSPTLTKQYSRGSKKRRSGGHHQSSNDSKSKSSTAMTASSSSKARVHTLLREVEKEFDALYVENIRLKEKLAKMEKGNYTDVTNTDDKTVDEPDAFEMMLKSFTKKNALKTRHKLKAQTSKIVSSFKPPGQTATLVKEYRGHRDGIWDIAVSQIGHPLLATASADKLVKIWGIDSGKCLMNYVGHSGSVNSVSFHPNQDLALSASGDGTAHVWKADPVNSSGGLVGSSDDSPGDSSEEDNGRFQGADLGGQSKMNLLRSPIITFTGHQNVVIGCQWLDHELAVTASWDRTANLYNVETGRLMQSLQGHDDALTHVACHPTKRLVATSSNDTTFRLWDFRETIHSVSVFQGHTEAVTSTAFAKSDQIISGSDDRSVKVWDLRNMRAPVTTIQTSAAVNRLSVSLQGIIAIPMDNRQVVLYDLSGQKILRLPRESSKAQHLRMVTSTCWAPVETFEQWRSKACLFSAGFDRLALGWRVRPAKEKEKDKEKDKEKEKEKDESIKAKAKEATF